jgi:hypothetical protein
MPGDISDIRLHAWLILRLKNKESLFKANCFFEEPPYLGRLYIIEIIKYVRLQPI